MIALFPIGHDESSARSIPVVSISLILICAVIFAATQTTINKEQKLIEAVQAEIESLKLKVYMRDNRQKGGDMITALVDKDASNFYELSQKFGERISAAWELFIQGKTVSEDDPYFIRYLELRDLLRDQKAKSIVGKFGLKPDNVTVLSLVTSMFLHGSLGHLLMNMFFLYLFGLALEDVWGRAMYGVFYILAGVVAGGFYVAMNPGSGMPAIGASGAIAGLMGAFLFRFYKVKIHFVYYYFLLRLHYGKFAVPALLVLPLWLAGQLLYNSLTTHEIMPIAFWAHIGGFCVGVFGAFAIKTAGLGRKSIGEMDAERLQELKTLPKTDLAKGRRFIDSGQGENAVEFFDKIISENPLNLPARSELLRACLLIDNSDRVIKEGAGLIEQYMKAENLPKAIEVIELLDNKEIQVDIGSRTLLKAGAHSEQKWENEKALQFYLRAAKEDSPAKGKALLAAARIHAVRLKNQNAARKIYRQLIDQMPNDPAAQIAKRELDTLK